jgi:hypothetical protein
MSNIQGPNVVTNGMVACWDVGNRASYPGGVPSVIGAITDLLGTSNGTLSNLSAFNDANLGSLQFNGFNSYIDVGNASALQITDAITLAGWYRPADSGPDRAIVAKYDASSQKAYKLYSTGGVVRAMFSSDGTTDSVALVDPSSSSADVWHYAVATNDGSGGANTALLYVDGILVDSETGIASIHNSTVTAQIGHQNSPYVPATFNGFIAHVAIYNVALSDEDVAQNWNALRKRFGV